MTAPTVYRSREHEYTGPPKECFLSDDWLARDLEAIFWRRWLVAGHVDELALQERHGYLTYAVGDAEVFIRRDDAGEIRAYHNVCPHRGARLCEARSGAAASKRVVCPYHLWTFDLSDGRLVNSRHMHEDFDQDAYGLTPANVSVWNGFIFVCFADDPPPAPADQFDAVSTGGFDLAATKVAATTVHEIQANWKIVVDNNMECYHCVANHPELMELVDWRVSACDDFDAFCAERVAGRDVFSYALPTKSVTIGGERVCRLPLPRSEDAEPSISPQLLWEPGVALVVSDDNAWLFVPRPLAADRTELRQYWLVARDAVEGEDYDAAEVKEFWYRTMRQDRGLCERVHRGMRNPAYRPGPLNRVHQAYNAGFFRWYERQIVDRFPQLAQELDTQSE